MYHFKVNSIYGGQSLSSEVNRPADQQKYNLLQKQIFVTVFTDPYPGPN